MSEQIELEMAVCTGCHRIHPTAYAGVSCFDPDCDGGEYVRVTFTTDTPIHA